ncbi:MAG: nucleotidyl transferase AbiEii/AbiGii toxin family protein [Phycisphaerales bacterium]
MDTVARMRAADRAELFRITAAQIDLEGALVEKDFWVCWTLGHLFDMENVRDMLMFKGGTALSKVFKLIDRFSEDIDLAIDYEPLGFGGDRDPRGDMSRTRREKLLEEMMASCRAYIAGPFLEALRERCSAILGDSDEWSVVLSTTDPNTIEFVYPLAGLERVTYVRPRILLELGTHAELIPSDRYTITSFAAEQFPRLFEQASASVNAIKAERTFWEKATILHAEHHRPADKRLPGNHARHYYDMAMLARSTMCDDAVSDLNLLRRVVDHKVKFYYSGWARYDLAVPDTLALVPPEARIPELRRNYDAMSVMMFGDPPPLEEILDELATLEARINRAGGS